MSLKKGNPAHSLLSAFLFAVIFFLAHLYLIAASPYDLYADEAQYWSWSKNLDWGYFSKPPVVAWIIAATGQFCGDTQFCIKLGSPILHFLTSLIVYAIGHRMFNRRVGFWSSVAYHTLPGITVSSYIISTDPPLLFFWALAFYSLVRALKDWHIKWWILLGIAAGFGMMSKYTMILFFASCACYFLFSKDNRVYFVSFKFWLSVFIAGAIYWKNFMWNKANGFVSYLHTKDNADLKGAEFHFDNMFEFIVAQFGVFGPIFFTLLIFYTLLLLPLLCKKEPYKLLFSFIVPYLGLITLISLLSRAHANWAAPVYIAATVLVVSMLADGRAFWIKVSVGLHIVIALVFFQFDNIINITGIELSKNSDPFRRVRNQKTFADKVKHEISLHEKAILLTIDRKTHSTLLYYLRDKNGNSPYIVKWNGDKDIDDHFDLTTDMTQHIGQDFILITKPYNVENITSRFANSYKSAMITIPVHSDYIMEYDIYYLKNFLGYNQP